MIESIKKILTERKNNLKEINIYNLKVGELLQNFNIEDLCKLYDNLCDASMPFNQFVDAYLVFKKLKHIPKEIPKWETLLAYITPPLNETETTRRYWESLYSTVEYQHYKGESAFSMFHKYAQQLPKSIKKELFNVPDEDELRIIHTADWHFDDDETLSLTEKSVEFIITKAKELKPHIFVIAGDSVHTRQNHDSPALMSLFKTLQKMSDIAPVFIITGTKNHDGLNIDIVSKIACKNEIKIVSNPEVIGFTGKNFEVIDDIDNAKYPVILFALPPLPKIKNNTETVAEEFIKKAKLLKEKGAKTVLVSHGTVKEAMLSTGITVKDYEFSKNTLSKDTFDLVLLGHIHKAQQIGVNIYYAGSIIRRDKSEQEEKGFFVHNLGGESEFITIPTRKIISLDFDCYPTLEMIGEIPPDADVRISYRINEEETHKINDEVIKEYVLSAGASKVKISRTILPKHVIRAKGISKYKSLPDKIELVAKNMGVELTEELKLKCETITSKFENIIEKYNQTL